MYWVRRLSCAVSVIRRDSFNSLRLIGSLAGAVVTFDLKGLPQWFGFSFNDRLELVAVHLNENRGQGIGPTLIKSQIIASTEGITCEGLNTSALDNHFLQVGSSLSNVWVAENE